jgi:hypothetical protein
MCRAILMVLLFHIDGSNEDSLAEQVMARKVTERGAFKLWSCLLFGNVQSNAGKQHEAEKAFAKWRRYVENARSMSLMEEVEMLRAQARTKQFRFYTQILVDQAVSILRSAQRR